MPTVTLEQLAERVDNGFKRVNERFDTNDKAHDGIIERQDTTNGNVTDLQLWRARMEGAVWVVRNEWRVILAIATIASGSVGVIIKFG